MICRKQELIRSLWTCCRIMNINEWFCVAIVWKSTLQIVIFCCGHSWALRKQPTWVCDNVINFREQEKLCSVSLFYLFLFHYYLISCLHLFVITIFSQDSGPPSPCPLSWWSCWFPASPGLWKESPWHWASRTCYRFVKAAEYSFSIFWKIFYEFRNFYIPWYTRDDATHAW